MKGRIIIALAIVLLLVFAMSLPAAAADEASVDASVIVDGYVSITLSGTIDFGTLEIGATDESASGQSEGNPAITITVEPETNVNVDIGIKGAIKSGTLAVSNWKYSTRYTGTKISIPESYQVVYTDAVPNDYPFYHWITIPDGTTSGIHSITISYKAVKTGTSFS
jgi:spore coat protein U-like protein